MTGPGEKDVLPCGCIAETQLVSGVPTFVFTPCALDCRYYLYVLEESEKQGNRITKIDAR